MIPGPEQGKHNTRAWCFLKWQEDGCISRERGWGGGTAFNTNAPEAEVEGVKFKASGGCKPRL